MVSFHIAFRVGKGKAGGARQESVPKQDTFICPALGSCCFDVSVMKEQADGYGLFFLVSHSHRGRPALLFSEVVDFYYFAVFAVFAWTDGWQARRTGSIDTQDLR